MRTLIAAALVALALTGCGSDDDSGPDAVPVESGVPTQTTSSSPADPASSEPSTEPADECEGLTDASSGRPLCEFEDSDSYDARLRIAKDPEGVLRAIQAVAPWLDESDYSDVISTCEEVARGDVSVDNAATRFSGGPDEQVSEDQARELIAISKRLAC